jgi:quercetin dioxygenase-like cupin family protein
LIGMTDRFSITSGESLEVLEHTPEVLVLEASWAPGGSPPPAHYHPGQDERFEMLEGAVEVELDGTRRGLNAGETLDILRGTRHRMWNPSATAARARWETRPAGRTEEWFRALAALQGTKHVDAHGRPKPLPFAAIAARYRDTFRLAAGPEPVSRAAVAALAGIARVTGQAP